LSPTRRDFIKTTAATAAAIVASPGVDLGSAQTIAAPGADPLALELAKEALDAARSAGASYADVRVGRYRRQTIATRERQVTGVNDSESYGIGVRTLVNGCWGFAATSVMSRAGTRQAALEAVALSKAARAVQKRRVELAPVAPVVGAWITPVRQDPLEVAIEDKIALLLSTNEAALKVKDVRFASSGLALLREVKTLLTSEGTNVTQTMIRVGPSFTCTATSGGDFQSYEEEPAPPPVASGATAVLKQAYETQPRDALWAKDTEAKIAALFHQDDVPADMLERASCRRAVCRVDVRWKREHAAQYVSVFQAVREQFGSELAVEPVGQLDEAAGQQQVHLYLARKGYTASDLSQ
jgi:TldD protein